MEARNFALSKEIELMSRLSHRDLENEECEQAYRRGYAYGVQAMMSAVAAKFSEDDREIFEAWFANMLMPWSQGTGTSHPPEPPRCY